jgi:hypothetical protein
MGHWEDTTVEVEYNGKKTRVAKQDAHLYETKKKVKEAKTEK